MKIYISGAFDQWRATTARQFLFFPPKCLLGIPIDKKGQTSIAGIYTTHSTQVQSEKRKRNAWLQICLSLSCRRWNEQQPSASSRSQLGRCPFHQVERRTDGLGLYRGVRFWTFCASFKREKKELAILFCRKTRWPSDRSFIPRCHLYLPHKRWPSLYLHHPPLSLSFFFILIFSVSSYCRLSYSMYTGDCCIYARTKEMDTHWRVVRI